MGVDQDASGLLSRIAFDQYPKHDRISGATVGRKWGSWGVTSSTDLLID